MAVGVHTDMASPHLYWTGSEALKERYLSLVRLSRPEGEAQLAERLESLSRRFPGRSYRWYLRWLVTDLERAKR